MYSHAFSSFRFLSWHLNASIRRFTRQCIRSGGCGHWKYVIRRGVHVDRWSFGSDCFVVAIVDRREPYMRSSIQTEHDSQSKQIRARLNTHHTQSINKNLHPLMLPLTLSLKEHELPFRVDCAVVATYSLTQNLARAHTKWKARLEYSSKIWECTNESRETTGHDWQTDEPYETKMQQQQKRATKWYKIKFSRHSHYDECERTSTQKYTWCIYFNLKFVSLSSIE